MMFREALIFATAGLLVGCASTDPGRGADITYYLPKTDVSATLTMTLTECGPTYVTVDAEAAVAGKAGVRDIPVKIDSRRLASARVSRTLVISTGDDLVLTGVNAGATDHTTEIIGSGLKILGALKGFALAGAVKETSLCKAEVVDTLARAALLKRRIAKLRTDLAAGPIGDNSDLKVVRELNNRAKELATLKTNLLQVTATGEIAATNAKGESGVVHFKPKTFDKWFTKTWTQDEVDRTFGLVWTSKPVTTVPTDAPTPMGRRTPRTCGLSIPVPAPIDFEFKAVGKTTSADGQPIGLALAGVEASATLPMAQLGTDTTLCLDVGFGEQRTVAVDFDKFGRTTKLDWSSEARGATVAGAVAGYLPDLATVTAKSKSPAAPSAIDLQKAEIDRLKTLKEYNELKACAAVYEAGGIDCKPEPAAP